MMFASRYRLSPHDAKALRVTDTYSLHRVVYGLFDDVREGDRGKRQRYPVCRYGRGQIREAASYPVRSAAP